MDNDRDKKYHETMDNLKNIDDILNGLKQAGIDIGEDDLRKKSDQIKRDLTKAVEKEKHLEQIEKKEGCFVATAVYGNYDHPSILILRRFRDNYLLKRSWGISFVEKYYEYGPGFAKRVKNTKLIKKVFYVILQAVVAIMKPVYGNKKHT